MQRHQPEPNATPQNPECPEVPFGSNEIRLTPWQWLLTGIVLAAAAWCVPVGWTGIEPFEPGADYRIPYRLGYDYWMYNRYCGQVAPEDRTLLVGDSVIWGHYVAADETLSHYLNELAGEDRFANLGVDGIHPAAMAGLLEYYGRAVRGRAVLLHANLLWMSSRRHDLRSRKEVAFNHPSLVPQFVPAIPCYRESVSGRLAVVVGRHLPFEGLVDHLEAAYFRNMSLATWTVERPYENPLGAVTLELPSPAEAPSPKPDARPWTAKQMPPFDAPWVSLDTSVQWRALRRAVGILKGRGNRVFVLVGPFNEHMLTPESRRVYESAKAEVEAWLRQHDVPHLVAWPLPSRDYADASHPLARGYAEVARRLYRNEAFRRFITQAPDMEEPG